MIFRSPPAARRIQIWSSRFTHRRRPTRFAKRIIHSQYGSFANCGRRYIPANTTGNSVKAVEFSNELVQPNWRVIMKESSSGFLSGTLNNFSRNTRLTRRSAAVLASAATVSFLSLKGHAQTTNLTWDPAQNANNSLPASGDSGTWNTTLANWSNGTADVVWADTSGTIDNAIFGGTAGTVTQNANLGAAEVIFQTPGYTINSGSNILLLGTASTTIDTSAIGSGAASLGNVDIGASAETWNVGSAALAFNGAVRDNGQSSTTLTVNGSGTTQLSGGLTLASGNFTARWTVAGSENINISGLVQDGNSGGNFLTYDGTATLSLSGTSNTFGTSTSTSNLAVDSGVLAVAASGSLGSSSNPLVLGNNTAIATFQGIGSSSISIANPVTLGGGGGGASVIGGSTPLNFTGTVTGQGSSDDLNINNTALTTFSGNFYLGASGSRTVNIGGTGNLLISAVVGDTPSGPGPCSLVYNGTGTLTLSNTSNSFTGNLAVDNGTLAVAGGATGTGPLILGNNTASPVFEGIGTNPVTISNAVTLGGGGGGTSIIGGSTPLVFTTVTGQGSSDDLAVNNTASTTFSGTFYLSGSEGNRRVLIGGTGSLLISAVVSDNPLEGPGINPSTLAYLGTGTMTVTNVDNNFSGDLAVQNGTVVVTSDAALGVGSTLFFGPANGSSPAGAGIFEGAGTSTLTIAHPVTIDTSTADDITFAGTTPLLFTNTITFDTASSTTNTVIVNDTGGVVWNAPVYLATGGSNRTTTFGGANNITIDGVVATGTVGVTTTCNLAYSGTGTMTLANANTYTGTNTVNSGVFDVANTSGSATGTGNVTLNGGVLASGSVGSIAGNVVAGSGAHTIAPGGIGSIGTLTIGGLTTSTLTTLDFDLGTGSGLVTNGDNLILGSGLVSIASGTLLTFGGATPVAGNDYQLIGDTSGSGAVVSQIQLANFTLPAAPAGLAYSLAESANFIDLDVTSTGPVSLFWDNAGGSGNGTNWDTSNQNWNNGSAATTYANGEAVTFNDTNALHYAVTLSTTVSPASVTVNSSGNYSITGGGLIVATGGFTKSNTSTLTLGVGLTASSLAINGGKVILASNTTSGSGWTSTNPVSNINVSSLTIAANSVLDIANNHIIIDYGATDPMSTILGYLKSGFNNGAWNGTSGIISSTAQTKTNGLTYSIGWADGADKTGAVTNLTSGEIELKYTLVGDANLDGTVNGSDFSILAANFGLGVTNWDQGNFLYSSSVNGSDFSALAANFGQGDSGAAVTPADIAALDSFAAANGLPAPTIAAVPEPASLGLLALGATSLLARRRRSE
jgi:autotransporter-associated beta strand protein